MLFWPGLDKWPPSKRVVGAAAVMTFVVLPLALLLGVVGEVIYFSILVVAIILGMRARLRRIDARTQEFREWTPDD